MSTALAPVRVETIPDIGPEVRRHRLRLLGVAIPVAIVVLALMRSLPA